MTVLLIKIIMTMSMGTLIAVLVYYTFLAFTKITVVVEAKGKVVSSLEELPFDKNGHLSTHIFAYPAGKCSTLLNEAVDVSDGEFGHQFMGIDGEAFKSVFGHLEGVVGFPSGDDVTEFNRDCLAVCLEKGTLRKVVARPLPHRYFVHGHVDQGGDDGQVNRMTVQDFFMSDSCAKVSDQNYGSSCEC